MQNLILWIFVCYCCIDFAENIFPINWICNVAHHSNTSGITTGIASGIFVAAGTNIPIITIEQHSIFVLIDLLGSDTHNLGLNLPILEEIQAFVFELMFIACLHRNAYLDATGFRAWFTVQFHHLTLCSPLYGVVNRLGAIVPTSDHIIVTIRKPTLATNTQCTNEFVGSIFG